jgi:hypothetical protein
MPKRSLSVTVVGCVCPAAMEELAAVSSTVETGSCTSSTLDPDLPSAEAMMVVFPALMPVAIPVGVIVVMVVSPVDQVTGRPLSVSPAASSSVAVACTLPPT